MLSLLMNLTLAAAGAEPELLIGPARLAALQRQGEVVVLHLASDRADYDRGHIPGARYLNPRALWISGGPGIELPAPAVIDSVLESVGVSNHSRVVLYGSTWSMPRVFLALDYVGMGDRTAVLDGGIAGWTSAGFAVSAEAPTFRAGSFTPRPRPEIVADAGWVREHLDDPGVALLDSRTAEEYHGRTDQEGLPRFGHIPGAKLLPWDSSYTNAAAAIEGAASPLRSLGDLRGWFAAAGVLPGSRVVTYCTVGFRASHMYFIARLLGYDARIYDGSMRDWSARPELPMVKNGPTVRHSMRLDPRQLAEWSRGMPNLAILHADRNRAAYDSAHVPSARFVALESYTAARGGVAAELPDLARLDSLVEALGVSDSSRIVVYGEPLSVGRLVFTLDYLGLGDRVHWLDGGLAAWKEAGQPVTAEAPAPRAGRFDPRVQPAVVVDADWVRGHLDDPKVAVLDARAAEEYTGERAQPETRPGHIPGAANLDWRTLHVGGKLRPLAELRAAFAAAGVADDDEVVTYCGTGVRASFLYLVARYLGYPTRLYDGSIADWSRRAELPLVVGPRPE
jgi:thiosulfate/3-mercaptopyruvate sulfurtransferase